MNTPTIDLYRGDCLTTLRNLPDNSVDSIVTDPPYGLSNTDPAKVQKALTAWVMGARDYVPEGKGFMGQAWDSFVPPPAVWDECYRVLKPGGHMAVFAGSRTQDLMGISVRLAGFDLRDSVAWLYGAGMPKSWNFGTQFKGDWCTCGGNALPLDHASSDDMHSMREDVLPTPLACGKSENSDMLQEVQRGKSRGGVREARAQGTSGLDGGVQDVLPREDDGREESGMAGRRVHRAGEGLPDDSEAGASASAGERLRRGTPSRHGGDDRTAGNAAGGSPSHQQGPGGQQAGEPEAVPGSHVALDDGTLRDGPKCQKCSGLRKEYEGWGTALKPGHEPIILARKPFPGTVAANVQEHGTGALNIDATRITAGADYHDLNVPHPSGIGGVYDATDSGRNGEAFKPGAGRWPANVILDEDQAAALDKQSGQMKDGKAVQRNGGGQAIFGGIAGNTNGAGARADAGYGSGGGASRFFYVAKAPKKERPSYVDENGDTIVHSTVKPVALMRWLVRLITPPGGTVLEPFAGTGTTGEAAALEGFACIMIERHEPYLPLIRARMDRVAKAEK